jgi:hypothetical protein
MNNRLWFQRCFNLAWVLFPEEDTARSIAGMAMLRKQRSMIQQDRRLKHIAKARTKVLISEEHLLQRLLFETSEPWERRHEAAGSPIPLRVEHLAARWVKHAFCISSHNSFWATIAKCRIVHRYTTAQTRNIYELLLQNPGRGKDDDQYRRVKKRFLQEMKERFHGRVQTVMGQRGEEHFVCMEQPGLLVSRADNWQRAFSPWGASAALIPAEFDRRRDTLPDLVFHGRHVDEEAAVEVCRIYTVFHPESFLGLAHMFAMIEPTQAIALPEFDMKEKDDNSTPSDGHSEPPALTERDYGWMENLLEREEHARVVLRPEELLVTIDGAEKEPVDAGGAGTISFPIGERDRLVEIYGIQGREKVCMGSLLILRDEDGGPRPGQFAIEGDHWKMAMVLENGQAKLAYGASAAQGGLRRSVERILEGLRPTGEGQLAPVMRLHAGRAYGSAPDGMCPCCGGFMLESTPRDGSRPWRTWKCDRCPYVAAHQA